MWLIADLCSGLIMLILTSKIPEIISYCQPCLSFSCTRKTKDKPLSGVQNEAQFSCYPAPMGFPSLWQVMTGGDKVSRSSERKQKLDKNAFSQYKGFECFTCSCSKCWKQSFHWVNKFLSPPIAPPLDLTQICIVLPWVVSTVQWV